MSSADKDDYLERHPGTGKYPANSFQRQSWKLRQFVAGMLAQGSSGLAGALDPFRVDLHGAVEENSISGVKAALAAGALVDATHFGHSALHRASIRGNVEIIELLLQRGANPGRLDPSGCSPLNLAISSRSLAAVRLLVKAGAPVNDLRSRTESPMHAAIRSGSVEVLQFLFSSGLVINHAGELLCYAAFKGFVEVLEILMAHGADPNEKDGICAFPLASLWHEDSSNGYSEQSHRRQTDVARVLINAGASVNLQDRAQRTALHVYACSPFVDSSIQAQLAAMLLERGANPDVQDCLGRTPLQIAVTTYSGPFVSTLLRAGAKTTIQDNQGDSAAAYVERFGSPTVRELFASNGSGAGDPVGVSSIGEVAKGTQ